MSRLYKYLGSHPVPPTAWRWCEKSPANVFYFGEILEHFQGQVRLIQMVRDGRDVTTSIHPENPDEPWVPIQRWVDAITAGLPYRSHEHVHTVRYTDLVERYEQTARRLFAFLGEEFTDEVRRWDAHARIRSSRNLMTEQVGSSAPLRCGSSRTEDFVWHDVVDAGSRVAPIHGACWSCMASWRSPVRNRPGGAPRWRRASRSRQTGE